MLIALQIENYAIIKSLQLTFDSGFTAITGETGAGKSILLGALSLILGHRADTSVLFDKSKKCIVEGNFNIKELQLEPFFIDNDLDYNDITTLRREISETGKSRAFINDTPVNLTQLKDLAQFLVDIHSQNNHLLIENQNFKIQIIDNFSNNTKLVAQFKHLLSEFKTLESELIQLKESRNKSLQEKDFLEFQSQELAEAKLVEGELEEIEKQITLLANAELIKSKLSASTFIISDKEDSILLNLNELKANLQSISPFNSSFEQLCQRVDSLIIELKDIDFEINTSENESEVNPDFLSLLTDRFDLLNKLIQKHRVHSLEELIQIEN
ncbi:MAG TPA: AAA family ATPase, partial [Bacteroidales bacterium]|nr:AAA family ATPase [Bacteroidales bacterium]